MGDDWPPITFLYQTYVPTARIATPGYSGNLTHPYLFFNGNDRPLYEPNGGYKTHQEVTVRFGSAHSITHLDPVVGETIKYGCTWPWGASCVEIQRARADWHGGRLAINDIYSWDLGGSFIFHVDIANPLYSLAPVISSDLHVWMAPGGTLVYGRHDNMPLHEIYFTVEGWGDEWYVAYASKYYNPVCLAGALPGCSSFVVVAL